jgi:glucose/arabinose dehydrogenase
MVRRIAALLIVVALGAGCAGASADAGSSSSASGAKLVSIGAGLRGPKGVTASVYATGLQHVAALTADPEGRVWAATAAYQDEGADAVYVIGNVGDDNVNDVGAAPVKVIAGLHTPLGLLWLNNELYVASNERVDAYGGFKGTVFTTHRTVVTFPSGVGELNGLALSPDGRIELGISAPCDACTTTITWSAAVVSFQPDGTDLQVDASGIRAPVGLAYFPGTSRLFVTMNQRDKLGAKTPGDWLSVVRAGQKWGFPACYGQDTKACTDIPKPVATLDKHAAASGVAIVTGGLGATVRTAAVVAEWAKAKVLMVPLSANGARATGAATSLLTGFKSPEALITRADGALLVGDWTTGKIYAVASAQSA